MYFIIIKRIRLLTLLLIGGSVIVNDVLN